MTVRVRLILLSALLGLAACETPGPYGPPPRETLPPEPPTGSAEPERPPSGPARPQRAAPREHTIGPAARALVTQARAQAASGDYAVAAASIERALKIEPENPLLWIELGKVRQAQGNHAQAEMMGRKALAAAADDPKAQSAAWRLIAESQRARGRVQEARESEARAAAPLR
jgi:tetratricopeptide (TPR) repeat protein